jgi:hypothetical protein
VHFSERLSDLFGTSAPDPMRRFLVDVRGVIFADRTWTGEAGAVQVFFGLRERTYLGLTDVIAALRTARVNAQGVAAIQAALSELDKPDQRDPDNVTKVIMRRNLDIALKMSARDPAGADEDMRLWLTDAEARWQVTQIQRVQGPQADIK